MSNWETIASEPGCVYSGQKSVSLPGAISTPPACMPTLRVSPSSASASARSSRTSSSFCSRSARSGSIVARLAQRDLLAGLERNELGDAVAEEVRQVEHAADVANRRLRGHRAERRDLRHGVGAVLLLHVSDHAIAAALAEVDVEVRHRHALGIQESLEDEAVAHGVDVGDAQGVGDERACPGAAAGTHRHAVVLRPVDEIGDDQEVAGEPHLHDGRGLEVEPRDVLGTLRVARRGDPGTAPRAAARARPRPRCAGGRPG